MLTYDLIVIGFGKAGKTLAGNWLQLAKKLPRSNGQKLCMVGLYINIGCIPTKTLLVAAEKDLSF